ncbi:TPA: KPN_01571 family protein [Salmonella enterica subsp. enterica]
MVAESVISALQNNRHTVYTLLALDAIREVMGVSSLTGLW